MDLNEFRVIHTTTAHRLMLDGLSEEFMNPSWFLNIIEDGDFCSLLCLLLCLSVIGRRTIHSWPALATWSRRVGLATLFAYACFRGMTQCPTTPDQLLEILLRGLLGAAFATNLSWIVLPVCAEVWSITGGCLLTAARNASQAAQKRHLERKIAEQRRQIQQVIPRMPEQPTPDQIQEQDRANALARIESELAETASRVREEARLRCELLYERHARQLSGSFPRERFVQFVERYMGEGTSPDLVEQRELLLKEMILDSLGTATAPKFATMTELAAFFEARRQEIENLPHDEEIKDTYRTQLNRQEDEALRKFLRP